MLIIQIKTTETGVPKVFVSFVCVFILFVCLFVFFFTITPIIITITKLSNLVGYQQVLFEHSLNSSYAMP